MVEALQISGLGNDRQRIDRPDTRDLSRELIVVTVPQQLIDLSLDLSSLPDQTACFGHNHPEHANGRHQAVAAVRSMFALFRKYL